MTGLSAGQRSMLRYWAMNMVWVRFNAIIFTYTPDEQRRLESIAKDVTENAFFGWAFFTALFYVAAVLAGVLIFIAPLLLLYPDTSKTPPALFMGATALMCVFALSVGMPLAMAIGGRITDRLAGTPPSPDAHGDAELYHKVLRQIGTMAVVGVDRDRPLGRICRSLRYRHGALLWHRDVDLRRGVRSPDGAGLWIPSPAQMIAAPPCRRRLHLPRRSNAAARMDGSVTLAISPATLRLPALTNSSCIQRNPSIGRPRVGSIKPFLTVSS